MLKNYLRTALRNLWKHKLFSAINILGLAVGMTVSVLALIELKSAYDYDLFHPFPQRTYRILTYKTFKTGARQLSGFAPFRLADELGRYQFIQQTATAYTLSSEFYSDQGPAFTLRSCFVNPGFFNVFGYKILAGHLDPAPFSMVITPETATKFFGKQNPIGLFVTGRDSVAYKITGIIQKETKTHLKFDALISIATLSLVDPTANDPAGSKGVEQSSVYILLKPGFDPTLARNALHVLAQKPIPSFTTDESIKTVEYDLQPLDEITPASDQIVGFSGTVSATKLLGQLSVGLVALFLAAFNYVNLTLARSISRAKEVGVRKVTGASKGQLFGQFVVESTILAIIAVLLSGLLLQLLRPVPQINAILGRTVWDLKLYGLLTGFTLVTGLLSGLAPARVLASTNPILAMKGRGAIQVWRGLKLQKALVVTQLTVSLTGIIFMIVMLRQQQYDVASDFGFTYENILNIKLGSVNSQLAKAELVRQPGVERVSAVSHWLGARRGRTNQIATLGVKPTITSAEIVSADADLLPLAGLTLLAGTNIHSSGSQPAVADALLNEMATQSLHFTSPANAIGQLIQLEDSSLVRICGIVKNFRNERMTHDIKPILLYDHPTGYKLLQVKVAAGVDHRQVRQALATRWKSLNPADPYEAEWYADQLYTANSHGDDIAFLSTIIVLVLSIGCLGLLGMVTYSTVSRTKEVGIRKVMGAQVLQLIYLLSREFALLLGVAVLISFPISYLISRAFLDTLVYRISLGAGIFIEGLVGVALLGGLTIGLQTWRAALADPVKSLQSE
ncbi:ABC transporter permease [Spirosoma gilvum]